MLVGAANGLLSNPQTARWLIQEGSFTASGRTSNTTFPIPYTVPPVVFLMEGGVDSNLTLLTNSFYFYGVSTVTVGGFTSLNSECNRLADGAPARFFWRSEGTAAYI